MRVFVPLANGFEETEFVTVVDILRRAEVEVVTASLIGAIVTGSHDIKIVAHTSLDKIEPEKFDAIILPGGFPGTRSALSLDTCAVPTSVTFRLSGVTSRTILLLSTSSIQVNFLILNCYEAHRIHPTPKPVKTGLSGGCFRSETEF